MAAAGFSNKFGVALKKEVEQRRQQYNTDMNSRKMPRPLVFLSEGERTAYMRNRCEQAKHTDHISFYKIENRGFMRDMKRTHNVLRFQKRRFDNYVARSSTPSATRETPPSLIVEPIQDFGKMYYAFYTAPPTTVTKNGEANGTVVENTAGIYSVIQKCVEEIERENDDDDDNNNDGDGREGDGDDNSNAALIEAVSESNRTTPRISVTSIEGKTRRNSTKSGKKSPPLRPQRPKSTAMSFLETPRQSPRPKTADAAVLDCAQVRAKLEKRSSHDFPDSSPSLVVPQETNNPAKRGKSARMHRELADTPTAQNDRHTSRRCKTAPPGGRRVDFDRSILSSERRPQIFDRSKAAYDLRQELKKPRKKVEAKKQGVDIQHERKVEKARWTYYANRVAGFNKTLIDMKKRNTTDINGWMSKEIEEKLNM